MTDVNKTDLTNSPIYLDVYGANDQFLMRTTMPVLKVMLDLHRDAVLRVEHEIELPGGVSTVYFQRSNCLMQTRITIQLAVGPRGNY